ncbi:MAG: efflux transporter outer membrane subunit [Aequorivita sp.]|nr:efflux transporter outer membrane subunit [Aequorivita sp.]
MKKNQFIYIGFLLLLISSCKTLDTNLSIREQKIPTSYNTSTDTTNITDINWQKYFTDEHLIRLIDTALVNNFDLSMALQRIEIARGGMRFSTGQLFPTIAADGLVGTNKYAKYTEENAGNSTTEFEGEILPNPINNFQLGLASTWEIDIWGKLRNQRKSAVTQFLASIEGTNFVITSLISDIAIAYYELLALDNELEIIRKTIQQQQEALDVVKLQKDAGRANELAVQQFKAQLLNSQALEKETLQQITETENFINFLLGRYPQQVERQKENLFNEIPNQIAFGIPSQLLQNRPDIREAELMVQASKYDLKSAKAAFFPNINLSAALGFQSFNPRFLFTSPASIGHSVSGGLIAPLINMSALKAQFNNAKSSQLTALYNYQKTILNGYVEVVNELSNIENLQQINSLKKQQNDVLIQSIETSNDLYKSGRATYLEVLLAQQNSLETQLELINTTKRQRISIINIYKALGGGWR